MTGDLTTIANVKAYLGKTGGDEDALLELIVSGVSGMFVRYCATPIAETRHTAEYHTGNGETPTLWLDHGPVTKLESVLEGSSAVDVATDVRFAGRGLTRVSSDIPVGWYGGQITIDYWAGYKEIPADVALAATIQSAFEYKQTNSQSGRLGLKSTSPQIGETSTFADHELLKGVRNALQPYRRFL